MDNSPEMITLSSALDTYCRHLGLNAENAAAIKSLVAPNEEGLISDFAVDRSELTKILDKLISR